MAIVSLTPPERTRTRAPRLSTEDDQTIIAKIKAGEFGGDGEPVAQRSTAYQRMDAVRKRIAVKKSGNLYVLQTEDPKEVIQITHQIWPSGTTTVDGAEVPTYVWAIGPKL